MLLDLKSYLNWNFMLWVQSSSRFGSGSLFLWRTRVREWSIPLNHDEGLWPLAKPHPISSLFLVSLPLAFDSLAFAIYEPLLHTTVAGSWIRGVVTHWLSMATWVQERGCIILREYRRCSGDWHGGGREHGSAATVDCTAVLAGGCTSTLHRQRSHRGRCCVEEEAFFHGCLGFARAREKGSFSTASSRGWVCALCVEEGKRRCFLCASLCVGF